MSEIERDIENWTRNKMAQVVSDAGLRCDIAGIDGRSLITMLMVELAVRIVSITSLPADDAGEMFRDGVVEFRKTRKATS